MTMLYTLDREQTTTEPPLYEPEIIDCPFITGGAVALEDGVLLFTGWLTVNEHGDPGRRVKVRFALPPTGAVKLYHALGALLSESHRARS